MVSGQFGVLDFSVVGIYLVASVALGSWLARGQSNVKDFLLAGRATPWWAAAISAIATDLSAISYMGTPAWVYEKDLQYPLTGCVMLPLGLFIVMLLYVPLFHRIQVYTVYEYLALRFNWTVRFLACILFMFVRVGWLATVIYTPAIAIEAITGIPLAYCVIGTGVLTTVYTVLGGMKAVIWTDVLQFVVLFGGALGILLLLSWQFDGGMGEAWRIASQNGHTRMFDFSFDPTIEITFWGLLFGITWVFMNAYGTDQVVVQRYLTVKSPSAAARSVLASSLLGFAACGLLALVGVGLVAYYATHPEIAAGLDDPKRVLPHFIINGLPAGLAGLLIAGILAATMSSISSAIQSLTTATIIDVIGPFRNPARQQAEHMTLGLPRLLTFLWGAAATVLALFVGRLGTFLAITGKIWGFFGGPLGGLFLLGVLSPRSNTPGALIGVGAGVAFTIWLSAMTTVSWVWWSVASGFVTFVIGAVASLFFVEPPEETRRLTLQGSRRSPLNVSATNN